MPLTANGLTIPRLNEIIENQGLQLRQNLGIDLDLSEDSIAGILNSIYSTTLSDVYELAEAIYSARDVYKAQGLQLDILATYLGTSRIGASLTRGDALFTGDNGTQITSGTTISTVPAGDIFKVPIPFNISSLKANQLEVEVASVSANQIYRIEISGSSYEITSSGSPSTTSIIDQLEATLTGQTAFVIERTGDTLLIKAATSGIFDATKSISVTVSSNLTYASVSSLGEVRAVEEGPVPALAGSLTKVETPVIGLLFVTNLLDLTLGRERETDEELRQRIINAKSRAGSATFDAVGSRILEVDNVESVSVIENATHLFDSDNRPPHSFEVVVVGGEDQDIGDTLWATKPAGIQTVGNTAVEIVDFGSNFQTVFFTRPEAVFIHIRIEYTLYDEEIFPSTGEEAMANIALEYGNALASGEDVISRRFIGPIYGGVPGIEDLVVKIDSTPNPGDTPTDFQEKVIPIAENEYADFDSARIEVVLV